MRSVAAVVALVASLHLAFWALARTDAAAPNAPNQIASVSYAPFNGVNNPLTPAEIRSDLRMLAPFTRAIRTYSSTNGAEVVPGIASEFGIRVNLGAWVDGDKERNEREARSAIDLARRHSNVSGIVVGNETIFRGEQTVPELVSLIQRVKRGTSVPVTTGEIWHVWMEHPELVSAVDYIAAHILPYWEGFSETQAVDQAILIYDKLRQAYPGKRVVIAEFGWPSAGQNLKKANPGAIEQAQVLRTFISKAEAFGIDYNIVEAIDQPWKVFEGGVGPYWGMFDADRQPKFDMSGAITKADHWKLAGVALLVGFLLSLPVLAMVGVTTMQTFMLVGAANLVGAWFAHVFAFWNGHYFVTGHAIALGIGLALLIPLVAIMLARIEEIAAIAFGRKPRRLINVASPALAPESSASLACAPKVSIHIPAYREPPEMLKQTLDAIARLEYPNFECIVIINNTPDAAFWEPVQQHCAALGERFKFLNVNNLEGFKAGALRLALHHTAPDAEVIGVLDADYVVTPDWLKDLAPLFSDAKVGLVQAPQDHRDGDRSIMHHAFNGEYAGFFDIGMVQRNEVNAIITHGTMCLIRRAALIDAGGWSSDTICEDTDLGLTILERGWIAHYTNKRYGHGLLPDTYAQFKVQRHRWAYGGFQIIRKHWRRFLPGGSVLTRDQKREFTFGWVNWLAAEALGVVVALLNLIWVPVVAFVGIAVPDHILTIPIVASFVVSVLHFVALYRLRVPMRAGQMAGSIVAAMSVQWTVARAVATGLVTEHLPFVRTAKGGKTRRGADFSAFWEAVIAALLIGGAGVLIATNTNQVREINLFAVVLVIQSVPFIAAALLATIERSRVNDFAYWRSLETRISMLLPGNRVAVQVEAAQPEKQPAELVP